MSHVLATAIADYTPRAAEVQRLTDLLWSQAKQVATLPPITRPKRKADRARWVLAVRRALAKRLNRAQSLGVLLLRLRAAAISAGEIAEKIAKLTRRTISESSIYQAVHCRQQSGMYHQATAAERPCTHSAASYLAQRAPDDAALAEFTRGVETLRRWADFCLAIDSATDAVRPVIEHDYRAELPQFPHEAIPHNARRAVSLLLALADGNSTENLPSQHRICGYTDSTIPPVYRVEPAGAETNRKPPSLKEGRARWRERTNRYVQAIGHDMRAGLRRDVIRKLMSHPCVKVRDMSIRHSSIFHAVYVGKLGDDIGARIVGKITGVADWNAGVSTIVTGRPVHIAGDDYAAPCITLENYSSERHAGWLLLRRSWNSSIHVAGDLPPAADISARIDSASAYYFRNRRAEAERRLSQRQRLARLAWAARKIDAFSLADSYASGNCRPGTAEWVRALGLRVDAESQRVSGRELVKRWRSASYPQPDRFGSVVQHLTAQTSNYRGG